MPTKTEKPSRPGVYWFESYDDPIGRMRYLVCVRYTRGPKDDFKGPLFAETYNANISEKYFYRAVDSMTGIWEEVKMCSGCNMPKDDLPALSFFIRAIEGGMVKRGK